MQCGKVQTNWKLAEVIAIYKKGLLSDRTNYRPVGSTSICCKILESLIRDHITKYLLEMIYLAISSIGLLKGNQQCSNYHRDTR